jgi:hypothetical protein
MSRLSPNVFGRRRLAIFLRRHGVIGRGVRSSVSAYRLKPYADRHPDRIAVSTPRVGRRRPPAAFGAPNPRSPS